MKDKTREENNDAASGLFTKKAKGKKSQSDRWIQTDMVMFKSLQKSSISHFIGGNQTICCEENATQVEERGGDIKIPPIRITSIIYQS